MGQKMEIFRVFTTTNSTIQCIYAPIALRIICDKKCRYCVENSLLRSDLLLTYLRSYGMTSTIANELEVSFSESLNIIH